jgi:hypothetical protein
MTLDK